MEKRSEHEAYEASKRTKNEDDDDLDDEEVEEEDDDHASDDHSELDDEDDDPAEEEAAPPKKRKAPARTKPRSRAVKIPRMKIVWGVFNNANQRIATFDYPKRHEAEEHAARLKAEKNATFFIQPVKEPFEEKKEA
jgi:hypothetical protein